MSYIKKNRSIGDYRSSSEAALYRDSTFVKVPKLNLEDILQKTSSVQVINAKHFSRRDPLKATRIKNNLRKYESLMKDPIKERLSNSIAEYTATDDKSTTLPPTTISHKPI